MEEIIQILIFVGVMVVSLVIQNAKNKNKPVTASPQEVLEDLFPEIEMTGDTESAPQPVRKPVSPSRKAPKKKQSSPTINVPVVPAAASKKERKIGIGSREEARRAFIYSEIFNRKY